MIVIILRFFETLINKLIQLDVDTIARIHNLNGKKITVVIEGLSIQFTISFHAGKLHLQSFLATAPDAVIKGTPLALMQLLLSPQANILLFKKVVVIEGETALLQSLKQILQQLDIDWEDYLSGFIGDIPAHMIGNRVKDVKHWGKTSISQLQQNFTEYVQEELQFLPTNEQLQDFMAEVDELRDDTERLAVRYERLQRLVKQKDKV